MFTLGGISVGHSIFWNNVVLVALRVWNLLPFTLATSPYPTNKRLILLFTLSHRPCAIVWCPVSIPFEVFRSPLIHILSHPDPSLPSDLGKGEPSGKVIGWRPLPRTWNVHCISLFLKGGAWIIFPRVKANSLFDKTESFKASRKENRKRRENWLHRGSKTRSHSNPCIWPRNACSWLLPRFHSVEDPQDL